MRRKSAQRNLGPEMKIKITQEMPSGTIESCEVETGSWDSNSDELIQGMFRAACGMGFAPISVAQSMAAEADEHLVSSNPIAVNIE